MNRLIPLLFIMIAAACSKKNAPGTSLTGKWFQIEYQNDTVSTWSTVTDINADKIEFKSDGTYKITPPMYVSAAYCAGTYNVVNDSTLVWGWSCTNPPVENTNKFSKEGNMLIIFYMNNLRAYKVKYKKVKQF